LAPNIWVIREEDEEGEDCSAGAVIAGTAPNIIVDCGAGLGVAALAGGGAGAGVPPAPNIIVARLSTGGA